MVFILYDQGQQEQVLKHSQKFITLKSILSLSQGFLADLVVVLMSIFTTMVSVYVVLYKFPFRIIVCNPEFAILFKLFLLNTSALVVIFYHFALGYSPLMA